MSYVKGSKIMDKNLHKKEILNDKWDLINAIYTSVDKKIYSDALTDKEKELITKTIKICFDELDKFFSL